MCVCCISAETISMDIACELVAHKHSIPNNGLLLVNATKILTDNLYNLPDWKRTVRWNVRPTEAAGCRELTQQGVLPCLAGVEGRRVEPWFELWWAGRTACHWRTVPPALTRSCLAASYWRSHWCGGGILLNVYKTPTSAKSRKEDRGRHSMYSMPAPWFDHRMVTPPYPVEYRCQILRRNPRKSFKSFPPMLFTSLLHSFALRFLFLETHATSYRS
jgi:hypothetical protein